MLHEAKMILVRTERRPAGSDLISLDEAGKRRLLELVEQHRSLRLIYVDGTGDYQPIAYLSNHLTYVYGYLLTVGAAHRCVIVEFQDEVPSGASHV